MLNRIQIVRNNRANVLIERTETLNMAESSPLMRNSSNLPRVSNLRACFRLSTEKKAY